jgi:membrane associated rhomboid family serine protease
MNKNPRYCILLCMRYTETQVRLSPEFTPSVVRYLVFITLGTALFSAFVEPFFYNFFGFSGPQDWLGLSWYNFTSGLIWQPFTYFFVLSEGYQGISFSFLISLAFQSYLIWIIGTMVNNLVGSRPFLYFYMSVGFLSGILAAFIGPNYYLLGPGPIILALMTVWMMMSPDSEILLLLMFPVKVKWLTVGTLAAIFLVYLSKLDIVYMTFYLSGALFGYIYAVSAWEMESPFAWTSKIERRLHAIGKKWRVKKKQTEDSSKIINFKTGEPDMTDDDRFVDVMLTKISKFGESSLSWSERRRLDTISKKKKR